ncbi:MAG: dihydroneopterin aldolase [candidate division Zixibacteria bacterium]|nr:dihydroneopterin aldolase [candidate division Zixibacteria bacterium]
MDRIRLVNMTFYGYHGVSTAEKETGRRFQVDCELAVDLAEAGKTDRLMNTIDYSAVYDLIADIVQNTSFSLLEGLAGTLAMRILEVFPVVEVTVRVRKMVPPISGYVDYIEVEVTRRQTTPEKLLPPQNDHE